MTSPNQIRTLLEAIERETPKYLYLKVERVTDSITRIVAYNNLETRHVFDLVQGERSDMADLVDHIMSKYPGVTPIALDNNYQPATDVESLSVSEILELYLNELTPSMSDDEYAADQQADESVSEGVELKDGHRVVYDTKQMKIIEGPWSRDEWHNDIMQELGDMYGSSIAVADYYKGKWYSPTSGNEIPELAPKDTDDKFGTLDGLDMMNEGSFIKYDQSDVENFIYQYTDRYVDITPEQATEFSIDCAEGNINIDDSREMKDFVHSWIVNQL